MFVSNLLDSPVGIDGIITLAPKEKCRFVPDEDDLIARVKRLVNAKMVAYSASVAIEAAPAAPEPPADPPVVEEPAATETPTPKKKRGAKNGETN